MNSISHLWQERGFLSSGPTRKLIQKSHTAARHGALSDLETSTSHGHAIMILRVQQPPLIDEPLKSVAIITNAIVEQSTVKGGDVEK